MPEQEKPGYIRQFAGEAHPWMRRFLIAPHELSGGEAVASTSIAVAFGVAQVFNGNWDVRAVAEKKAFASDPERSQSIITE
ncbi:MAG: hypothetical protein WDN46_24625 [Methylocella sp.]